jgi:hypothetical protein
MPFFSIEKELRPPDEVSFRRGERQARPISSPRPTRVVPQEDCKKPQSTSASRGGHACEAVPPSLRRSNSRSRRVWWHQPHYQQKRPDCVTACAMADGVAVRPRTSVETTSTVIFAVFEVRRRPGDVPPNRGSQDKDTWTLRRVWPDSELRFLFASHYQRNFPV